MIQNRLLLKQKMKRSYFYLANLIISIGGLITILILVFAQIIYGNICPDLLSIPACYVILFLIIAVILSHLKITKDKNFIYFIGSSLGLLIATYFSTMQIQGSANCPQCLIGIPLCYAAFVMFNLLLILKILEIRSVE